MTMAGNVCFFHSEDFSAVVAFCINQAVGGAMRSDGRPGWCWTSGEGGTAVHNCNEAKLVVIPGAQDVFVPPGAARSSLQKGDLGEFGLISWGCSAAASYLNLNHRGVKWLPCTSGYLWRDCAAILTAVGNTWHRSPSRKVIPLYWSRSKVKIFHKNA